VRVGIDYRPALVNREGIGRYARELVRALCELDFDRRLGLFGYTLAPARYSRAELGLAGRAAELVRLRLPSSALPPLLARLGKGADDLVGGASVYHHTQLSALPVRAAAEVLTLYDCIWAADAPPVAEAQRPGFLDGAAAARMLTSARELARRARRVLVPSEFVAAEVVMTLGVAPARVVVTPLGCDHLARGAALPMRRERAGDPYVVTVCRVDARKNHVRVLAAFERLVREGFPHRWIVAGPPGHGAEDFARALERSSARERVSWRRDVPDEALPALYAGADACAFMSLAEGFGLPPLEAMACGTPVLASGVTSLPEVLGDAALYAEPTDVDAIFEGLRRLLADRGMAEDCSARGRAHARRFTWRATARATLAAYQAATEPDSGPPVRRAL
jgi:glycosyltransferase involved in cell wall biosynthesis